MSGFSSPDADERLRSFAKTLKAGAHPIRPFHWELEFPEVFARDDPGFDAIVGNPPFAGKNNISNSNRPYYAEWLQSVHEDAHGNSDLVAHFFRRAFTLTRATGVLGLLATKTIGQGDTRSTGLAAILLKGGTILRATRRLNWPGEAAVVVSVVHIAKGEVSSSPILDDRPATRISAYLVEGKQDESPHIVAANLGRAFQGSVVLGMGFTFDDIAADKGTASTLDEMDRLIAAEPENRECIFPYIGGEEITNDPRHGHRRWVINFGQRSEESVRARWPKLMQIVEEKVKPERLKQATIVNPARWWMHARPGSDLYSAIKPLARVVAVAQTSPHVSFAFLPNGMVYAHTLVIFALSTDASFATMQARVHEIWTRAFAASMKRDQRYIPSDCFATFPFPEGFETDPVLEAAGQTYHDHRARLMVARNEGMTKTYNRFHNANERGADIATLRDLHTEMDRAVLRAYGWDDLAEGAAPAFLTEVTEDDETYQNRLFWPSAFRDEVLARLLKLNAERYADEERLGLHSDGRQPPRDRGLDVFEDLQENLAM